MAQKRLVAQALGAGAFQLFGLTCEVCRRFDSLSSGGWMLHMQSA